MKIKEEWKYDHDKGSMQIKKVHDTSGVEHRARVLRDTIGEEQKGSEHKLVVLSRQHLLHNGFRKQALIGQTTWLCKKS